MKSSQHLTVSFPDSQRGKASVAAVLPVELRHQGSVRVPHQEDGAAVKSVNHAPFILVCLNADCCPTLPVVLLPFEP